MKLSYVVPAYNVEEFLDRCLTSIINLNMSQFDYEVIVVNDGSTDKSQSIAEKYLNMPNFKLINQENRGLSAARNIGLAAAVGDYICFIDSDDYYHKFNMQEVLNIIKKENPDIYYFNYEETSNLTSSVITSKPEFKIYSKDEFYKNVSFSGHIFRIIIKRNLLKDLYFDEGRVMEDIGFVIDLFLRSEKFIYDERSLYGYYINQNSILRKINSEERNFKFLDDTIFAIHRIQRSLKMNANLTPIEQDTIEFKIEELFLFLFASFQFKRVSYQNMKFLDRKSGFVLFRKIFRLNFNFVLRQKVKFFNSSFFRTIYYRILSLK